MDKAIRIVSFDPGSFMGITASEIIVINNQRVFRPLESTSVDLQKRANKEYSLELEIHDSRFAKSMVIKDVVSATLRHWEPDFVICEAAYMGKFPSAFGSLIENIAFIRLAIHEYSGTMGLILIDPSSVKKEAGTTKINKDKSLVKQALTRLKDMDLSKIDLDKLDQHAIDSIAIGYYCFKVCASGLL